jgi:hypothetical protein
MKIIWKFELDQKSKILNLPKDTEILTVQIQHGTPQLWVLVDPKKQKEQRCFETIGTGHQIPYDIGITRTYIGTFQLMNGALIYHVFEKIDI